MAWTSMTNLSAGDVVTEADMDAIRGNIEYLADNGTFKIYNSGSNYETSSATFVAVDTTNLRITHTCSGHPIMIGISLTADGYDGVTTWEGAYDIKIDSTTFVSGGASFGLMNNSYGDGHETTLTWVGIYDGISAGSHTFDLYYRQSGTTARILNASNSYPITFWVKEGT